MFDGDSLLPLVPPQKNQCSFRVYNSLTDNAMEPAIVSRTMCTELQRAEQEVACRCRLPTSTATNYRSRIPLASFLSVLPRNIPGVQLSCIDCDCVLPRLVGLLAAVNADTRDATHDVAEGPGCSSRLDRILHDANRRDWCRTVRHGTVW